jgi:hypothetical protein
MVAKRSKDRSGWMDYARQTMDANRNLNPHAAARVAMTLYCDRYANQNGGSMDFWDSLTPGEKKTCADLATEIRKARPYTGV